MSVALPLTRILRPALFTQVVFLLGSIIGAATIAMSAGMIFKMVQGDYNADDKVEDGEAVFYLGSGFGCANAQ